MPDSTPLNRPIASLSLLSCPVDDERALSRGSLSTPRVPDTPDVIMSPQCEPQTPPPEDRGQQRHTKVAQSDDSKHVPEMLTPASLDCDKKEEEEAELNGVLATDPTWPCANEDFTSVRVRASDLLSRERY